MIKIKLSREIFMSPEPEKAWWVKGPSIKENPVGLRSRYRHKDALRTMPRYRVVRNQVAAAIIHIESYLTILGLIEQKLANPNVILERLIEIRCVYLEFQRLFYSGSTNRPRS